MWNSLYVQCENLGRDSLAWYLEFNTFHICPFATGWPKTQINEMELFLSLLHEGKCGHHCFFMKYGSICHSLIYIKTDIFLPESMEFSVSPLSGWKCSLRQSVTSIFQGEKANGDFSGRSMVISALPKNFSLWNHWFFFFFCKTWASMSVHECSSEACVCVCFCMGGWWSLAHHKQGNECKRKWDMQQTEEESGGVQRRGSLNETLAQCPCPGWKRGKGGY